jgi:hypothetical protein
MERAIERPVRQRRELDLNVDGLDSESSSQFIAPHGEDIMYFSEKGSDRLLGVGNNRIHLLLIQYFLHGATVGFHLFSLLN